MRRSDGKEIFVLGLTGGIGSGKSTVRTLIESYFDLSLDADQIASKIIQKDDALEELKLLFGESIFINNNQINRKKLAEIVFNDKNKLKILNNIMHKRVADEIIISIDNLKEGRFCLIDCAIPINRGFLNICDEVWLVYREREERIKSVMARNSLTRDEVLSRINSQLSDEEYLNFATKIIKNNGTIDELKAKVSLLINDFLLERRN